VASLSQGRTAAAQCGLFTYKSVPVIFEPPCTSHLSSANRCARARARTHTHTRILQCPSFCPSVLLSNMFCISETNSASGKVLVLICSSLEEKPEKCLILSARKFRHRISPPHFRQTVPRKSISSSPIGVVHCDHKTITK